MLNQKKVLSFTIGPPTDPAHERWLDSIVSLQEAAELRGVCVDTLKRQHAKGKAELLRVSDRRWGMRRRHALLME